MSTDKDKIKKRWCITRWNFDPITKELESTDTYRTKHPITEREARELALTKLGPSACWQLKRAYK